MNVLNVIKLAHIPSVLRGANALAWFKVLLTPVQYISDLYDSYTAEKLNELKYNGQVMYIEKALNDKFDNTSRRIYIDDSAVSSIVAPYMFRRSENQNTIVLYRKAEPENTVALYRESEIPNIDFTVFVPAAIISSIGLNRLKSVVKFYKIASKTFQIQSI